MLSELPPTQLHSDCTESEVSGPADPLVGKSTEDLFELLSDRQRERAYREFYEYLDTMNFVSEIEGHYSDLIKRVQSVGTFAIAALERCKTRAIEQMRESGQIQIPGE